MSDIDELVDATFRLSGKGRENPVVILVSCPRLSRGKQKTPYILTACRYDVSLRRRPAPDDPRNPSHLGRPFLIIHLAFNKA